MARASSAHPTKLALVAYWYGPPLCAENARQIRHTRILMVNARPGCSHVTISTRQPLPAYSRGLVSLQAACSNAMQTECTRHAGSSRLASGTPSLVAFACVMVSFLWVRALPYIVIVRSDREYSLEWPRESRHFGTSQALLRNPESELAT
jgi:hypothetical protein